MEALVLAPSLCYLLFAYELPVFWNVNQGWSEL
jgi:hypothetical protein